MFAGSGGSGMGGGGKSNSGCSGPFCAMMSTSKFTNKYYHYLILTEGTLYESSAIVWNIVHKYHIWKFRYYQILMFV